MTTRMKSVKDQVRNEWRNLEARDERSSAEMLTERLADPDADAATSPTACVSLDSAAGSGRVHWSCVGAGSDKRTRSVRRLPSYDRSLTKPHGYRGRVWLRLSILLPQSFLRLFSRISFFFFYLSSTGSGRATRKTASLGFRLAEQFPIALVHRPMASKMHSP